MTGLGLGFGSFACDAAGVTSLALLPFSLLLPLPFTAAAVALGLGVFIGFLVLGRGSFGVSYFLRE